MNERLAAVCRKSQGAIFDRGWRGGVFLDTVGLLAVWDVHDQWHDAAFVAFAHHLVGSRDV
jgi:hypothetical protein